MPIREASQPLFHQVYRRLAEEIDGGGLRAGDRLPSERWLCDELGVSRATVRRAIEELVRDGLVEGRGRGSYVCGDAVAEPRNTLMSLSELGRSRGLEASARALDAGIRAATIDEADAFGIAPGAELFVLRRLRLLDGMPIALDLNRVPLRLAPSLPGVDFSGASLYAALEADGHRPARADYDVEARAVDTDEAELLELTPGAPVLLATTVAFDEAGRIVDMGRTVYRADRYRFQATLMRRSHTERESRHDQTLGGRGRRDPAGGRRGRLWGDAGRG
jgi:DNA-binding GntR family transcriptional regulator